MLRPSAPVRELRGKDPVSVEIEVNSLVAKPLSQIAPANLADLFALSERTDLTASLQVRLRGYNDRIARAIGDLPNGDPLAAYLTSLGEVEASRVPMSLRAVIVAEAERPSRSDKDRDALAAVQQAWTDVEPTPFDLAAPKAVQQVPEPKRRTRTTRTGSAGKADATPVPDGPKRSRIVQSMEQPVIDWVTQCAMERLARQPEKGLLQDVIVAGVKHRSREKYPQLTPREVLEVLKFMEAEGRIKHSAGRWRALLRRYGR